MFGSYIEVQFLGLGGGHAYHIEDKDPAAQVVFERMVFQQKGIRSPFPSLFTSVGQTPPPKKKKQSFQSNREPSDIEAGVSVVLRTLNASSKLAEPEDQLFFDSHTKLNTAAEQEPSHAEPPQTPKPKP